MALQGKTFRLPCLCSKTDVKELQVEMQRLLMKQQFITTWDPETLLPPHTDVILESCDGKQVYAHRATLVNPIKYKNMCSLFIILIKSLKLNYFLNIYKRMHINKEID